MFAQGSYLCDAPECVADRDGVDLNAMLQTRVEVAQQDSDDRSVCKSLGSKNLCIADVRAALVAAGGVTKDEAKTRVSTTNWGYLKDALDTAEITTKEQFAMFFANVVQESGRLKYKEEVGADEANWDKHKNYDWGVCTPPESAPCKEDAACKKTCTKHYYGRGYLQLSWMENYENASADVCGTSGADVCSLVTNPEKAATEEGAWKSAAWYWKTAVGGDFTKWSSSENKMVPHYTMGETILGINGALECTIDRPTSENYGKVGKKKTGYKLTNVTQAGHAKKRFCFYKKIYESLFPTKTVPSNDKRCVETVCSESKCDDCHDE